LLVRWSVCCSWVRLSRCVVVRVATTGLPMPHRPRRWLVIRVGTTELSVLVRPRRLLCKMLLRLMPPARQLCRARRWIRWLTIPLLRPRLRWGWVSV